MEGPDVCRHRVFLIGWCVSVSQLECVFFSLMLSLPELAQNDPKRSPNAHFGRPWP